MRRIITVLLALIVGAALIPGAAFASAAPAQTTEQIFNAAALTPRLSTNPTVSSYTKAVMAEIIPPSSKLSGYQQLKAAYDWTHENIAFAAHYILPAPEEVSTYPEDAAIWGFEEGEGPCEVDAAVFMYLARYIGYDAQWAYGRAEGDDYHYWVEILIDGKAYAFDTYPNMEKSFQLRTDATLSGFPFVGYFLSGGPINYNPANTTDCANVGNMNRTKRLDGTVEPTFGYDSGSAPTAPAGLSASITTSAATDGKNKYIYTITKQLSLKEDRPDFSWSIPYVSKQEMTMAGMETMYSPGGTKEDHDFEAKMLGSVADQTVIVLDVKAGTKISIKGASIEHSLRLEVNKDGKLQPYAGNFSWPDYRTFSDSNKKVMDVGAGDIFQVYQEGDYMSYNKEGYFLQDLIPWSEYHFVTSKNKQGNDMVGKFIPENVFRWGYVVIHVVP